MVSDVTRCRLPDLKRWLSYFQRNPSGMDGIDWGAKNSLTAQESSCIATSIAAFQLGEYSEGRGLIASAKDYAAAHGIEHLVAITRLFVREEQTHAQMLKQFMLQHDLPLVARHWSDDIFRRLRKNVGYEVSVTVLITAEIAALSYYRALSQATGSPQLQAICTKIIADETAHVEYESEVLAHIRHGHAPWRRRLTRLLHRALMAATLAVVYREHRAVLVAGGYPLGRFWRSTWRYYQQAFR